FTGKRVHIAEAETDKRAACRRRRIERDGRTVVLPEDRRPPRHAILGEIVICEVAAAVVLLAHDGLTDIAVEEEPRAVLREPFDGLGKIGVAEGLAGLEQRAPWRKNPGNVGGRIEDRGDNGEEVSLEGGERKSTARRAYRWLHQS